MSGYTLTCANGYVYDKPDAELRSVQKVCRMKPTADPTIILAVWEWESPHIRYNTIVCVPLTCRKFLNDATLDYTELHYDFADLTTAGVSKTGVAFGGKYIDPYPAG